MTTDYLRKVSMSITDLLLLPSFLCLAGFVSAQQSSDQLAIVAPADGTVVAPQQTVTVTVVPAPGISFKDGIQVLAENIGITQPKILGPFDFILTVPNDVIGSRKLTALGVTGDESGVFSQSISIDIETPVTLSGLTASPPQILLNSSGQQISIAVAGAFIDGSRLVLTRSARISFQSADAAVAVVNSTGTVTAISSGKTGILVQYAGTSLTIPVTVATGPSVSVSAFPATLWPPNGAMIPVTVSGAVQDAGGGIRAGTGRFQVIDEYGTVQPKGSVALAADGSYFFTVLLEASRRGGDRDGRQYSIIVSAKDSAGNPGSASTSVVVPHDQAQ